MQVTSEKLPPMSAGIAIPRPLEPKLRDLAPEELHDVFQAALTAGTLRALFDECPLTDLTVTEKVKALLGRSTLHASWRRCGPVSARPSRDGARRAGAPRPEDRPTACGPSGAAGCSCPRSSSSSRRRQRRAANPREVRAELPPHRRKDLPRLRRLESPCARPPWGKRRRTSATCGGRRGARAPRRTRRAAQARRGTARRSSRTSRRARCDGSRPRG